MHAIKMTVDIRNNHFAADLPIPLPNGKAEVIVLYEDAPEPAAGDGLSLIEFFAQMDRRPLSRQTTREEVDAYLAGERASWDD